MINMRKLNKFFDYKREKQFLAIYYVGIKVLDIDMKHKLYVTNNFYNMFRRINYFLKKTVAKLESRGYKDLIKIPLFYDPAKYEITKDGKRLIRKDGKRLVRL